MTLTLNQRLEDRAPSTANAAAVVGFIWACLLLASGIVFNHGMGAVVGLHATDPALAVSAWQVIEPVAETLGGAGGEVPVGVWILLFSHAALRTKVFPAALNGLGVAIGVAGIVSVVPALNGLGVVFGLLQIVWFAWIGIVMLRRGADAEV